MVVAILVLSVLTFLFLIGLVGCLIWSVYEDLKKKAKEKAVPSVVYENKQLGLRKAGGGFVPFQNIQYASVCRAVKNYLIDEAKKEGKYIINSEQLQSTSFEDYSQTEILDNGERIVSLALHFSTITPSKHQTSGQSGLQQSS